MTEAIPTDVRALSTLARLDYADLFSRTTTVDATPEVWARAMFGNVPDRGERLIWRTLLRLRLADGPSPATVAGWTITGRDETWIRLEADGPLLAANLLVCVGEGRVSLATCIRYESAPARGIWWAASAVHRALVPAVLRDAERRAARSRAADP